MGIKSIGKFLHSLPQESQEKILERIHISDFKYKRIAVDISIFLCIYKHKYNNEEYPNKWLSGFLELLTCLRKNEVHCVFIFETSSPQEKQEERKRRSDQREKNRERYDTLNEALDTYSCTGEVDPVLQEFQKKRKFAQPRLLTQDTQPALNVPAIEYALNNFKKQFFTITPADIAAVKELFDILDIPYFTAPLEAETMCADLCLQGKVEAVLSRDTDILAYETPIFLTDIDTKSGTCTQIKYSTLLEELNFTSDQFLDFCIMCGTDYNKNIFRVGPAKSFGYISDYKNIETFSEQTGTDVTILNHKRGRQLFRQYEHFPKNISYCGQPNFELLEKFAIEKRIFIDVDSLCGSFTRANIVFEENIVE